MTSSQRLLLNEGNAKDCLINEPGLRSPERDNDLRRHFLSCCGKVTNAERVTGLNQSELADYGTVFM